MKKISAEIVADSVNEHGNRITTFLLTFPRFILAELNTHRMFSRNSASSRAVPVDKMIKAVRENTFCPFEFQKSHKGMQGSEYFTGAERKECVKLWLESAELALQQAEKMKAKGISKQIINRILEPYQYYTALVTATEFKDFFNLRCPKYEYYDMLTGNQQFFKSKKDWLQYYNNKPLPKAKHISKIPENDVEWLQINKSQAEIHIQALAEAMWDAMNESTPKELKEGEYHIPFGDRVDEKELNKLMPEIQPASLNWYIEQLNMLKLKISTARCARLSYMTFDGEIDYGKDIQLHDRLLAGGHMSPFEHCARVMSNEEYRTFIRGKCEVNPISEEVISPVLNEGWCNNFKGFIQYRYLIENKI